MGSEPNWEASLSPWEIVLSARGELPAWEPDWEASLSPWGIVLSAESTIPQGDSEASQLGSQANVPQATNYVSSQGTRPLPPSQ